MNQKEELRDIISDTRYPTAKEQFIPSDVIAEAILSAGFAKKPISASRRMIHASLLAFYPGIHTVKELQDLESLERRMGDAIYAAFAMWKQEGA